MYKRQEINYENFNISKSQFYVLFSKLKQERFLKEEKNDIFLNLEKIDSFLNLFELE